MAQDGVAYSGVAKGGGGGGGGRRTTKTQRILFLMVVFTTLMTLVYNAVTSSQMEHWLAIKDGIPRRTTKHDRRRQRKQVRRDFQISYQQKEKQERRTRNRRKYKTAKEIVSSMTYDSSTTESSTTRSSSSATTTTNNNKETVTMTSLEDVTVGTIGKAVAYAREYGLQNRIKGMEDRRHDWDILATEVCLEQDAPDIAPFIRKQELPHALLIGVQKGGTTALYSYLEQHPNVIHSKKELYILDEKLDQILLRRNSLAQPEGIPRRDARSVYALTMRQAMKGPSRGNGRNTIPNIQHPPTNSTTTTTTTTTTNDKIRLDATPHYIYLSDRVPQRILCIMPWVKVFALLRNPIDRAFSSYNMKLRDLRQRRQFEQKRNQQQQQKQKQRQTSRTNILNKNNNKTMTTTITTSSAPPPPLRTFNGHEIPTFDEYIRMDLAALYETGVIQDWTKVDFHTFSGSKYEFQAWQAYLYSGLNAPIGMGLYSLQIKHLLKQFERHNKNSQDDLLVLSSETLQNDTDRVYGRVLDFLGLDRLSLQRYVTKNVAPPKLKEESILSPETEQLLQDVFEPYNRELTTLLGKEWDGIWMT